MVLIQYTFKNKPKQTKSNKFLFSVINFENYFTTKQLITSTDCFYLPDIWSANLICVHTSPRTFSPSLCVDIIPISMCFFPSEPVLNILLIININCFICIIHTNKRNITTSARIICHVSTYVNSISSN